MKANRGRIKAKPPTRIPYVMDVPSDISQSLNRRALLLQLVLIFLMVVGAVAGGMLFINGPLSHFTSDNPRGNSPLVLLSALPSLCMMPILRSMIMSKPARTLSQMVNEEMMQGEEFEIALFKLLKMAPWSNHRVGISVTPQSKDVDMKPMGEKRWSVDFEDKAAKISFRPLNRR